MDGQTVRTSPQFSPNPCLSGDFPAQSRSSLSSESFVLARFGLSMNGILTRMRRDLQELAPHAAARGYHWSAIADACDELWTISQELIESKDGEIRA